MRYDRLAILGPPGAGKGTQAKILAKQWGLMHVSTGDILRSSIKAGSVQGRQAESYIRRGRLVPDELVRDMAEDVLTGVVSTGFVLDGYPRNRRQARWLTAFLGAHSLDAVLWLSIPEEVIVQRLSRRRVHRETGEIFHLDTMPPTRIAPELICQRSDDYPEAIRQRLRTYNNETEPVGAYYRGVGTLVQVSAEGSVSDVRSRIAQALELVQSGRDLG